MIAWKVIYLEIEIQNGNRDSEQSKSHQLCNYYGVSLLLSDKGSRVVSGSNDYAYGRRSLVCHCKRKSYNAREERHWQGDVPTKVLPSSRSSPSDGTPAPMGLAVWGEIKFSWLRLTTERVPLKVKEKRFHLATKIGPKGIHQYQFLRMYNRSRVSI